MTRFALQPRWLAWHLLVVVVLVSFTWLGRWQLGAFEHKAGDLAAGARRTVALDSLTRPGGRLGQDDLGRSVRTVGSYDGARTLVVPDRPEPDGDRTGFLVVTPLRTDAGVLPVVRGWVPRVQDAGSTAPPGQVAVRGLLQRSEDGGGTGGGAADSGPGRLPYVATVTVLDALPYRADELYDGFLALRAEDPTPVVRPEPVQAQLAGTGGVGRWRNLAYALQWWVFAGAAVFFWWIVLRRAALERADPPSAPSPPSPPGDADPPSLVAPRRTT